MATSGDVRCGLALSVFWLCLGCGPGVIGDTPRTEEFQVTEVSLERTDQGFVVTLRCRGAWQLTSGNVRLKEGGAPLPLILGQTGRGVIVFQTPGVEGEDVSPLFPLVTLYLPHRYHSLSLRLLPLPRLSLPFSQNPLPPFSLKVEPGYDVTFEPGSDIDLTVTTRFGGGDDAGTNTFETALYRKSALRDDLVAVDYHDDDHLLQEVDQAGWGGGNQYRRYTVRTSALREGEGEGVVLELTSTVLFSCPDSACAVQGYSVTAHVTLRPDHRPGMANR